MNMKKQVLLMMLTLVMAESIKAGNRNNEI